MLKTHSVKRLTLAILYSKLSKSLKNSLKKCSITTVIMICSYRLIKKTFLKVLCIHPSEKTLMIHLPQERKQLK